MKLGIVGSRTFDDYKKLLSVLTWFELPFDITAIVSGGAKGADSLAERYANEKDLPKIIIKPEWKKYGIQAGFIRNREIIKHSDMLIAFWDGHSRGTKDTIDKAARLKRPTLIIYI